MREKEESSGEATGDHAARRRAAWRPLERRGAGRVLVDVLCVVGIIAAGIIGHVAVRLLIALGGRR